MQHFQRKIKIFQKNKKEPNYFGSKVQIELMAGAMSGCQSENLTLKEKEPYWLKK